MSTTTSDPGAPKTSPYKEREREVAQIGKALAQEYRALCQVLPMNGLCKIAEKLEEVCDRRLSVSDSQGGQ